MFLNYLKLFFTLKNLTLSLKWTQKCVFSEIGRNFENLEKFCKNQWQRCLLVGIITKLILLIYISLTKVSLRRILTYQKKIKINEKLYKISEKQKECINLYSSSYYSAECILIIIATRRTISSQKLETKLIRSHTVYIGVIFRKNVLVLT